MSYHTILLFTLEGDINSYWNTVNANSTFKTHPIFVSFSFTKKVKSFTKSSIKVSFVKIFERLLISHNKIVSLGLFYSLMIIEVLSFNCTLFPHFYFKNLI